MVLPPILLRSDGYGGDKLLELFCRWPLLYTLVSSARLHQYESIRLPSVCEAVKDDVEVLVMHLPYDSRRAYDDTRGPLTAFALMPSSSITLSAALIRRDLSDMQSALVEAEQLQWPGHLREVQGYREKSG